MANSAAIPYNQTVDTSREREVIVPLEQQLSTLRDRDKSQILELFSDMAYAYFDRMESDSPQNKQMFNQFVDYGARFISERFKVPQHRANDWLKKYIASKLKGETKVYDVIQGFAVLLGIGVIEEEKAKTFYDAEVLVQKQTQVIEWISDKKNLERVKLFSYAQKHLKDHPGENFVMDGITEVELHILYQRYFAGAKIFNRKMSDGSYQVVITSTDEPLKGFKILNLGQNIFGAEANETIRKNVEVRQEEMSFANTMADKVKRGAKAFSPLAQIAIRFGIGIIPGAGMAINTIWNQVDKMQQYGKYSAESIYTLGEKGFKWGTMTQSSWNSELEMPEIKSLDLSDSALTYNPNVYFARQVALDKAGLTVDYRIYHGLDLILDSFSEIKEDKSLLGRFREFKNNAFLDTKREIINAVLKLISNPSDYNQIPGLPNLSSLANGEKLNAAALVELIKSLINLAKNGNSIILSKVLGNAFVYGITQLDGNKTVKDSNLKEIVDIFESDKKRFAGINWFTGMRFGLSGARTAALSPFSSFAGTGVAADAALAVGDTSLNIWERASKAIQEKLTKLNIGTDKDINETIDQIFSETLSKTIKEVGVGALAYLPVGFLLRGKVFDLAKQNNSLKGYASVVDWVFRGGIILTAYHFKKLEYQKLNNVKVKTARENLDFLRSNRDLQISLLNYLNGMSMSAGLERAIENLTGMSAGKLLGELNSLNVRHPEQVAVADMSTIINQPTVKIQPVVNVEDKIPYNEPIGNKRVVTATDQIFEERRNLAKMVRIEDQPTKPTAVVIEDNLLNLPQQKSVTDIKFKLNTEDLDSWVRLKGKININEERNEIAQIVKSMFTKDGELSPAVSVKLREEGINHIDQQTIFNLAYVIKKSGKGIDYWVKDDQFKADWDRFGGGKSPYTGKGLNIIIVEYPVDWGVADNNKFKFMAENLRYWDDTKDKPPFFPKDMAGYEKYFHNLKAKFDATGILIEEAVQNDKSPGGLNITILAGFANDTEKMRIFKSITDRDLEAAHGDLDEAYKAKLNSLNKYYLYDANEIKQINYIFHNRKTAESILGNIPLPQTSDVVSNWGDTDPDASGKGTPFVNIEVRQSISEIEKSLADPNIGKIAATDNQRIEIYDRTIATAIVNQESVENAKLLNVGAFKSMSEEQRMAVLVAMKDGNLSNAEISNLRMKGLSESQIRQVKTLVNNPNTVTAILKKASDNTDTGYKIEEIKPVNQPDPELKDNSLIKVDKDNSDQLYLMHGRDMVTMLVKMDKPLGTAGDPTGNLYLGDDQKIYDSMGTEIGFYDANAHYVEKDLTALNINGGEKLYVKIGDNVDDVNINILYFNSDLEKPSAVIYNNALLANHIDSDNPEVGRVYFNTEDGKVTNQIVNINTKDNSTIELKNDILVVDPPGGFTPYLAYARNGFAIKGIQRSIFEDESGYMYIDGQFGTNPIAREIKDSETMFIIAGQKDYIQVLPASTQFVKSYNIEAGYIYDDKGGKIRGHNVIWIDTDENGEPDYYYNTNPAKGAGGLFDSQGNPVPDGLIKNTLGDNLKVYVDSNDSITIERVDPFVIPPLTEVPTQAAIVPTVAPTIEPTNTFTPTEPPTNTSVPPTNTNIPTATATNTQVPTSVVEQPTITLEPIINQPTAASTNTIVPPTNTNIPTATNTPTNLPTNTPIPASNTPIPATETPTGTPTERPTNIPTNTATETFTSTPVPPTSTNTQTPTSTFTPELPTETPVQSTATGTNTATATLTPEPPTSTPSQTVTQTNTEVPTSTLIPPTNIPAASATSTIEQALTNTSAPTSTSTSASVVLEANIAKFISSQGLDPKDPDLIENLKVILSGGGTNEVKGLMNSYYPGIKDNELIEKVIILSKASGVNLEEPIGNAKLNSEWESIKANVPDNIEASLKNRSPLGQTIVIDEWARKDFFKNVNPDYLGNFYDNDKNLNASSLNILLSQEKNIADLYFDGKQDLTNEDWGKFVNFRIKFMGEFDGNDVVNPVLKLGTGIQGNWNKLFDKLALAKGQDRDLILAWSLQEHLDKILATDLPQKALRFDLQNYKDSNGIINPDALIEIFFWRDYNFFEGTPQGPLAATLGIVGVTSLIVGTLTFASYKREKFLIEKYGKDYNDYINDFLQQFSSENLEKAKNTLMKVWKGFPDFILYLDRFFKNLQLKIEKKDTKPQQNVNPTNVVKKRSNQGGFNTGSSSNDARSLWDSIDDLPD